MLSSNTMTPPPDPAAAEPALPDIPCKVEDFGAYGVPTKEELVHFWDACRPWLAKQGIHLYALCCLKNYGPHRVRAKFWTRPSTSSSAPLPYATLMEEELVNSRISPSISRVVPAQDLEHRNVMLKLVDYGSSEHQAYRRIMQTASSFRVTNSADFPCVLPPLAVLETSRDFSFIVLPMWGSPIHIEGMSTVGEVLDFIECMLRGLSYLHDLRIVHRDICEYNMVVNFHSPGVKDDQYPELLRKHRHSNEVLYALMDYDQSLVLPQDTSLTGCRRPATEAKTGNWLYKPDDINLGEPYYNPFAYDVGTMGFMFRKYFVEAVAAMPSLAALFDRLTDYRLSHRLTAKEALLFVDTVKSAVSHDTLKIQVVLEPSYEAMCATDTYWSKLSPEDQSSWGCFRTPQRPFLQRALDCITDFPMGWEVVRFVRHILRM
ncbi:hypothetical protein BV20DRAFT_967723 [Pilatotrama ljubarskyi]|nr:hypothetical protein BV20DRAFT_967723 [Pilatotrama ljubarskyi]